MNRSNMLDESRDAVPPLPRRPYSSMSAGSLHYTREPFSRPSSALSTGSDDAIRRKEDSKRGVEERRIGKTGIVRIKAGTVISPLSRARQQGVTSDKNNVSKIQLSKKSSESLPKTAVSEPEKPKRKPRPMSFHAGMSAPLMPSKSAQTGVSPLNNAQKNNTISSLHKRTTSAATSSTATTVEDVSMPPTPTRTAKSSSRASMGGRPRPVSYHVGASVTPPRSPKISSVPYDEMEAGFTYMSFTPPKQGRHQRGSSLSNHRNKPVVAPEPLGARDPAVEARSFAKRLLELDSYYGIGKIG